MKLLFRPALGLLAALLGAVGVWILTTELLRPSLVYFPVNAREAAAFGDARDAARTAARIGVLRSDLWAAAAITEAAPLLFVPADARTTPTFRTQADQARRLLLRTARRSPHDSRIWLALAGLETRADNAGSKAGEALKISYYTGPNEFTLAPVRLSVASSMVLDDELQSLTQSEIQRILLQRSDLRPAIASAYRSAVPSSRQLFEATLKELDPGFLSSMSANPRP